MSLKVAIQRGVYFCSDSGSYSHAAFCLADGLDQLGVPVYSNIPCSHTSTSFAFQKEAGAEQLRNSFCAVLELQGACDLFPHMYRKQTPIHERTVALCMHDNIANFCLDSSVPLFCTHENRFRQLEGTRIPIGFGISQNLLQYSVTVPPFLSRDKYVLDSFRPSLHQDVRACLELLLIPNLQKKLTVEKRYTNEQKEFWELLKTVGFCLGYGGMFTQNLSQSPFFMSIDTVRDFWSHVVCREATVITRWDSWRFWESLACGCVTIHLDFDRYGFKLPVMPENWKHYVGIDLANVKQDVERIMDEWDRMEEIAWNGRLWALEHYSPIAVARRFLETVHRLECPAGV